MHLCSIDWGVHLPLVYMRILLYVKCTWCNGLVCSYGQLRGSICHAYMCIVQYLLDLPSLGVAVFKASMFNWQGVHQPLVYMCILRYVKLLCCNGLACSYDWWGVHLPSVLCALSYMWNLFGVMVLHAAMVNLGGSSACSIYEHCPMCQTCVV